MREFRLNALITSNNEVNNTVSYTVCVINVCNQADICTQKGPVGDDSDFR